MNVLLVGYGNMGSAIAELWYKKKIFTNIYAIDPSKDNNDENKIISYKSLKEFEINNANVNVDIILLAFKPQDMDNILKEYTKYHKSFIVSIIAGKTINYISKFFKKNTKIIRIMPNICAKLGISNSLVKYSRNITEKDKIIFRKIIKSFGSCIELQNEKLFHVGTVLFGSGPAHFYLLCNKMIEFGIKFGIKKELMKQFIPELFLSSTKFFENEYKKCKNNESKAEIFNQLLKKISSKGGVTEKISEKINDKNFTKSYKNVISAAIKKSKEL